MDVLAYLPPLLHAHLKLVLASRPHQLHTVERWAEAESLLRQAPIDVLIVDPTVTGGWDETRTIGTLARRYSSLGVVVYTTLTPAALQGVVQLAQAGVSHLVLFRFDDDVGRFGELLDQLAGAALREQALERLAPGIRGLPPRLAQAVETLFRYPQRFAGAEDLSRWAEMPRRTLYRAIEAAGLGSPSRLVKGARMLQAYAFLRDPGYSLEDVARKCGFSSRQLFARQVRELSGLQPRELRRLVSPPEFLDLLAARLMASSGGSEELDGA